MSFSIVTSDNGVVRLAVEGELDEAAVYVLRLELANLLRRRPERVAFSMTNQGLLERSGQGLLLSFFALLRAQGGVVLSGADMPPVATDQERPRTGD